MKVSQLGLALKLNEEQYLEVMKTVNQTKTRSELRNLFERNYNYTELLTWEHERLNYTNEPITRYTDPFQILNYGKGRCQEFSILYAALCLANGYEARFVIDLLGDHTWVEIELQGVWTHVDPTEKRVDDPYMYERDWHKNIELVYAFEDGFCEDVTDNYRMPRETYILIF
jgi:hypothetical protein